MNEALTTAPAPDEQLELPATLEQPTTGGHLERCTWCSSLCVVPDTSVELPECVRCAAYGARK